MIFAAKSELRSMILMGSLVLSLELVQSQQSLGSVLTLQRIEIFSKEKSKVAQEYNLPGHVLRLQSLHLLPEDPKRYI